MTETSPEDHEELVFEFDLPINPVNFKGDSFEIKRNDKYYGSLVIPIKTSNEIADLFNLMLLFFGYIICLIFALLAGQNLTVFTIVSLFLIASILFIFFEIFFNPFIRFLPVQITAIDNSQSLLRCQFDIHKLNSIFWQNYWIFKDYSHHNAYSLYFSHNKGILMINKSKIVLNMKKYNSSTLELSNQASNFKFTTKLKNNIFSWNKVNFIISTPNNVDEHLVLFIGFVLYRTGQLNSLLYEGTVVCTNCNNKCSEDDKFCPKCQFRLKVKDFDGSRETKFDDNQRTELNIAKIGQNPKFNQTDYILAENSEFEVQASQKDNIPIDGPLTGLQMDVLQMEVGKNLGLGKIYLVGSSVLMCVLLLLCLFKSPLVDLPYFILLSLGFSFLVGGPLLVIPINFQFKEHRFYYNSLTPNKIVEQVMSKNYKLVKQNQNHYIFKKNKRGMFSVVLVFEKSFFILYGSRKLGKQLFNDYVWQHCPYW